MSERPTASELPSPFPGARLTLAARSAVSLACFVLTAFAAHLHTAAELLFCFGHALVWTWLIFESGYRIRQRLFPQNLADHDPPWRRSTVVVTVLGLLTILLNLVDRFWLNDLYLRLDWLTIGNAGRFYDADLLVRLCTLLAITGYISAQLSFLRMEHSLRSETRAQLAAAEARRQRDHARLETERAEADARRARQLAAEAELAALRMQINPHFLFNTLGTIAALARLDGPRAGVMTERLAEMFRYALQSSQRPHTSLGEELDFLQTYFEIERARFGDRLQLSVGIPDNLRAQPVPNLLLQPMVENAIEHAFKGRSDHWQIEVSARLTDDGHLAIAVADNGVGFGPADPYACLDRGTALQNIDQRLRRAYGDECRLRITRREPHGAVFTALIPLASRS